MRCNGLIHHTAGCIYISLQIYTLTVLNGNETWTHQPDLLNPIKNGTTNDLTAAAALDFDSILNTFSGYIRTEFAYDGSGFSDNKDDVILSQTQHGSIGSQQQPQQQQQQVQINGMTNNNNTDSSLATSFQNNNTIIINNNNNDWQMANNNITTADNHVSVTGQDRLLNMYFHICD